MNILQSRSLTKTALVAVIMLFAFTTLLVALPATASAASVATTIPVRQVFDAPDGAGSDGVFTYRLTPQDPANPMPVSTSGLVGGSYEFTIEGTETMNVGPITFTHAGLFYYDVQTVVTGSGRPGYTYDNAVFTIIVDVRNAAGNTLTVEVRAVHAGTVDPKVDVIFNQEYTFLPTEPGDMIPVDPPVVKSVQGNPAEDYTFTFRLRAQNPDNPMPEGSVDGVKDITITGSGSAEFGVWVYDRAGVFVYVVTEIVTDNQDYRFDASFYTITDTVSDEGGRLQLSRVVTNHENRQVESMSFINTYTGGSNDREPGDRDPDPDPDPDRDPDRDGDTPGGGTTGGGTTPGQNRPSEGPKTGDYANPMQIILIMVASAVIALFLVYLIYVDRKSEKEHVVDVDQVTPVAA
ncbi:MAG: hypothetical protein FWD93_05150 [Coriobacteriia bacterium]|nr:hypothetical protein [Coriobacteriia bacterium]